jgi:ABC-type multidrug transport system fused ATPase/permease subunit
VIAHHLEPLLSVDKVVVMEAGTVVEQGSPVSLLANSTPASTSCLPARSTVRCPRRHEHQK